MFLSIEEQNRWPSISIGKLSQLIKIIFNSTPAINE